MLSDASGAGAVDVDRVVFGTEPVGRCRAVERLIELGLEVGVEGDIGDGAAVRADQVMVVLGELLGELVAGMIAGAVHDASNRPRLLEHGEVAIRRALRQRSVDGEQLRQRVRRPIAA